MFTLAHSTVSLGLISLTNHYQCFHHRFWNVWNIFLPLGYPKHRSLPVFLLKMVNSFIHLRCVILQNMKINENELKHFPVRFEIILLFFVFVETCR